MANSDMEVILRTLNRNVAAVRTIQYLRRVCGFRGRIIVVDQTTEGNLSVKEYIRRYEKDASIGLRIIEHRHALGTAKAGNVGASVAEAEWLLFVDDDVRPCCKSIAAAENLILSAPWLDCLVARIHIEKAAVEEKHEERCVICTGAVSEEIDARQGDDSSVPWSGSALQYLWSLPTGNVPKVWVNVAAGMLLVRRRSFFDVGGFDERFKGVGEDTDLGMRLWRRGYITFFHPAFCGVHSPAPTGGRRCRKMSLYSKIVGDLPDVGYLAVRYVWFPFEAERVFRGACLHLCKPSKLWPFFPVRFWTLMQRRKLAKVLAEGDPQLPFQGLSASAEIGGKE